jgi:hypothetical protein
VVAVAGYGFDAPEVFGGDTTKDMWLIFVDN